MRNFILTSMLLASFAMLTACETTAGLGRDLSKGGRNIEDAAKSLTP